MPDSNINKLIGLNATGLHVADFTDVYQSVTDMFKEIYGSDIDLSTGTADGIYVWQYSLIINNILQSIKTLYSNLDVRYAEGEYLDKLCALTNVYRQQATASFATLTVTYIANEGETLTLPNVDVVFVDKNEIEWEYNYQQPIITLEANTPQSIIVTCSETGEIRAPAGWITQTVANVYNLEIVQDEDADVGTDEESDEQLRARRSNSAGSIGISVVESIIGTLLEYSAIKDIKIYNNDSTSLITAKDGTIISSHNQYIIIRRLSNIAIADKIIGTNIFEKMTPGIHTTMTTCDSSNGISHVYIYQQKILGQEIIPEGVIQNVYWKEAKGINPTITITIQPLDNFASANNSTCELIKDAVIDYMNELQLSEDPIIREIENAVYYADPLFKGQSTYDILDVELKYTSNPDTYYNYTSGAYEQDEKGNWVITIS